MLKELTEKCDKELKEVSENFDEEMKLKSQHQLDIEEVKKQHEKVLEGIMTRNGKELSELSESHQKSIDAMKEQHVKEVESFREELSKACSTVQVIEEQKELEEEKESFEQKLKALKEKNAQALVAETNIFEDAITKMRKEHEENINEVRKILEKEALEEKSLILNHFKKENESVVNKAKSYAKINAKDSLNSSFKKLSEGEVDVSVENRRTTKKKEKSKDMAPVLEEASFMEDEGSEQIVSERGSESKGSTDEELSDQVLKTAAKLKQKLTAQNKKILRAKTYLKRETKTMEPNCVDTFASDSSSDPQIGSVISYPLLQRVKGNINSEAVKLNHDLNRFSENGPRLSEYGRHRINGRTNHSPESVLFFF